MHDKVNNEMMDHHVYSAVRQFYLLACPKSFQIRLKEFPLSLRNNLKEACQVLFERHLLPHHLELVALALLQNITN